jgi:hypothetical protein
MYCVKGSVANCVSRVRDTPDRTNEGKLFLPDSALVGAVSRSFVYTSAGSTVERTGQNGYRFVRRIYRTIKSVPFSINFFRTGRQAGDAMAMALKPSCQSLRTQRKREAPCYKPPKGLCPITLHLRANLPAPRQIQSRTSLCAFFLFSTTGARNTRHAGQPPSHFGVVSRWWRLCRGTASTVLSRGFVTSGGGAPDRSVPAQVEEAWQALGEGESLLM